MCIRDRSYRTEMRAARWTPPSRMRRQIFLRGRRRTTWYELRCAVGLVLARLGQFDRLPMPHDHRLEPRFEAEQAPDRIVFGYLPVRPPVPGALMLRHKGIRVAPPLDLPDCLDLDWFVPSTLQSCLLYTSVCQIIMLTKHMPLPLCVDYYSLHACTVFNA